jgi:hypothetical protein
MACPEGYYISNISDPALGHPSGSCNAGYQVNNGCNVNPLSALIRRCLRRRWCNIASFNATLEFPKPQNCPPSTDSRIQDASDFLMMARYTCEYDYDNITIVSDNGSDTKAFAKTSDAPVSAPILFFTFLAIIFVIGLFT